MNYSLIITTKLSTMSIIYYKIIKILSYLSMLIITVIVTMGGCIMEGDPAPRPADPCQNAVKSYRPVGFWDLKLKYNASSVMRDARLGCGDILSDLIELEQIHPYFNKEEPQGEFTSFVSILNNAYLVDDESRKPCVSFTYTGLSCTGSIEKKYNSPNDTLMYLNQIPEVPTFPNNALKQIVMKVQTVKTYSNQVQFMWTQTINCEKGIEELHIVFDPNFTYSSYFDAFRPGGTKSGSIAIRERNDGIELVKNTINNCDIQSIKESIISTQNSYKLNQEQLIITPILEQNVYSNGTISSKKWDAPVALVVDK